jgi:TolB-like protein/DNA-binding winged helix-turn-helix (wHTH) protein/Tfp pilus assembly protein PilF
MTTPELRKALRFGPFEVDLRARELRKLGLRIKLQGKPFQILTVLLDRPGETVTREELRRSLWPNDEYGEFDQSLNTAMKKLRHALGDSAVTPRFIETQSRQGYRFVAPVQVISAGPAASPVETSNRPTGPIRRRSTGRWVAIAAVAFAIFFMLQFPRVWHERGQSEPAGRIRSIAVLPLMNLNIGEHDYFADGLTDALITNLSRIGALRVISRTSAMHYKDTHKLLSEIGRELKVDGVVEGSVQRAGQRVRVSIKLLQVATEQNLWADIYEGDLRDIFALESEMAGAVARNIGVRIASEGETDLSRSLRLDPEAYEAYLKGRFFWNKRSADGLQKALRYFHEALEKEPAYALAYAGLADCYNLLSFYGGARPTDSFPKAKAAAMKALELDESMAEAHAALGYARLHFDWDWPGAEAEFRRALELNPGYANALHWRSHYLLAMGQTEEAFETAKRALDLDPLNQSINAHLGHHFIHSERYDDAVAQMKTTLEMNPASARCHALLGRAFEGKRMFREAKAEFQEAIRLSGEERQLRARLAHVYASEGNVEAAREMLNRLEKESPGSYVSPYALALAHTALGEYDRAFQYLARAYDLRQEELIYIKTDPDLKPLRSDPRFAELVRRIRLPA